MIQFCTHRRMYKVFKKLVCIRLGVHLVIGLSPDSYKTKKLIICALGSALSYLEVLISILKKPASVLWYAGIYSLYHKCSGLSF